MNDYNFAAENKDFSTRVLQIISGIQKIGSIPGEQKIKYYNLWADYWRYVIGVNVIPADTKNKKTSIKWLQYQNSPISEEQHNKWKQQDAFINGMAIIAGRVWHNYEKKGLFLILVDLDNQIAIDEFCTRNGVTTPLGELAKTLIVEQHDDQPDKAHVIFYASHPFRKKSTDTVKSMAEKLTKNEIPAIEIKGAGEHGILFVTPSVHKYGKNYHIIGTIELGTTLFDALETHLDNICNKYGIPYLTNGNGNVTKQPIDELFNEDTKIYEGHNRHEAILRVMESLLRRNLKILSHEQIKPFAIEWNQKHCIPPLDNKEFERQWNDAIKFIEQTNVQYKQREKYPELGGNVYYRINEKPEKYIIAYRQYHKTIEVTATTVEKKSEGNVTIEKYLKHNRTYLACTPVRIVRHMNPLAFLETPTKYSITFVDSVGETNSLNHKTLAEIVQSLRDLGYVLSDGADMALAAMVQAYKENKLIEDNEDIEYIGFFTDKDNTIIASNVDIVEPDTRKLLDAIIFLVDELKQHFENRLDLLATSVVWGMVAPLIFMLKTNNYFLKALDYYGFANATKSNTGKIVLALDGHQEDARYAMQFSRIDTPARLGQAVSRSTFPILVDEVNLSDEKNAWLVNALKSIIESRIARSKFTSSKASSTADIPALSCLILTSNSPPPFHDSACMRRLIARNFPQSESWKENDAKAQEFKEFLRINLPRLKALGDFRNWYVMNNQQVIVDEKRPLPLDLGLKILKVACDYVGKEIPAWLLEQRLSENQLEESIQDNDVIVKRAFEKYIDEQVKTAILLWREKLEEEKKVDIPNQISERLVKLVQSNLLPDMRFSDRNLAVIIKTGILTELYSRGVSKDQLPNLKALADYMNADYRTNQGKRVIIANKAQLSAYFDEMKDIE